MLNNYAKLLSSEVLPEDIKQEVELLKLEGKKPSKWIVAKRLVNNLPDLQFSYWLPKSAKILDTIPEPLGEEEYTRLVEYLYSTNIDIGLVVDFLDNPEDKTILLILVEALQEAGYITEEQWETSLPKQKSIRELLLEYLSKQKYSVAYIDLVKYISSMHTSKRPSEAVRISLKRLIKSKDIQEKNGRYSTS